MTHPPYDLFSRHFKTNPFPTFAYMRAENPIYLHDAPNGLRIWYITRYEDVVIVLKDNDNFVKNLRNALPAKQHPPSSPPSHNILQLINQNMLFADPPDHTRLRTLVSQAFTPRRVQAMSDKIQEIANNLLDTVKTQGHVDLISNYALPLPFIVITDMLGIPSSDREQVKSWSQAIIAPGSRGISVSERKRKIHAFVNYVQNLFAQRQQTPQDDLLTALVEAEEAGDKLTNEELSSMVMLLLVTGYETTVNLIGNGVFTLLQHPKQLALIKENPTLMDNALEEILRYDGPVETSTSRWACRDLVFKGHQMKRGDLVRVVLTSANRDETQCLNPHQFDIHRPSPKHLSFGLGIHYCLGAPLARLEAYIALNTLWARFPNIHLALPASSLEWRSGVLFRGLKKLPLVW